MFAGINMFWARLRLVFKMSLRRAQNIFMPKNINSITINITLEGIEKIKTKKNDNKTLRRLSIFFTRAVRIRQQTLKWLLDFDWLLYHCVLWVCLTKEAFKKLRNKSY